MLKGNLKEYQNMTFEELVDLTKKRNSLRMEGYTEEQIEQILLDEENNQEK